MTINLSFSYNDNKKALAKGCFSPFHISKETTEFLLNLGGKWTFYPNKMGVNKGIKFVKPVVLNKANVNCKSVLPNHLSNPCRATEESRRKVQVGHL